MSSTQATHLRFPPNNRLLQFPLFCPHKHFCSFSSATAQSIYFTGQAGNRYSLAPNIWWKISEGRKTKTKEKKTGSSFRVAFSWCLCRFFFWILILRKFSFLSWLLRLEFPATLSEILLFIFHTTCETSQEKEKGCFLLIGSMEFWRPLACGKRRRRFCS